MNKNGWFPSKWALRAIVESVAHWQEMVSFTIHDWARLYLNADPHLVQVGSALSDQFGPFAAIGSNCACCKYSSDDEAGGYCPGCPVAALSIDPTNRWGEGSMCDGTPYHAAFHCFTVFTSALDRYMIERKEPWSAKRTRRAKRAMHRAFIQWQSKAKRELRYLKQVMYVTQRAESQYTGDTTWVPSVGKRMTYVQLEGNPYLRSWVIYQVRNGMVYAHHSVLKKHKVNIPAYYFQLGRAACIPRDGHMPIFKV